MWSIIAAQRLWFRCNTWLHEGAFSHPNVLVQGAKRAVEDLQLLNQGREGARSLPLAKWQKSAEGWVKMNCDVACDKQKGCKGMCVLIRDHTGKVKAARSTTRLGCFKPAVAEPLALLHRLLFCKEIGIQNVMVEGDAQVVITALQEGTPTGGRFGHIVNDMRMVLQDVSSWQASDVRRDANGAAYSLAKLATRNVIDRTWMNTTPEYVYL